MRNQGLGSWIVRRAKMTPDRVAIIHDDVSLTYGDLQRRILALARGLMALGVRRGDRVGYLGLNHPAAVETLFATGMLGAIYVALNVRFSHHDLVHAIDDAGCRVVVFGAEQADVIVELRDHVDVAEYVVVGRPHTAVAAADYDAMIAAQRAKPLDEVVSLDDICLITYTSGSSTGIPKGVTLSHGNVTWNVFNVLSTMDFQSDDVHLFFAPMRSLGVTLLPTIFKGGTIVMQRGFDIARALSLITKHRVTTLFGTPEVFAAILDAPHSRAADLSSLRLCIGGGAVFPESVIRGCIDRGIPLLQGYGLTETAPLVLMLDKHDMLRKVGSAGRPPFFVDVRIVDRELREVPPRRIGEIIVRGPNVMKGYWNLPEVTDETITSDGWLRTGDAAWCDDEGYVFVVGRVKDALQLGGETVFPPEIENVLREHPAVADCAVVMVPDAETTAACVVLRPDVTCTKADLLAFGDDRLPAHMRPKVVQFVPQIPRNANEKIVRSKLLELVR